MIRLEEKTGRQSNGCHGGPSQTQQQPSHAN